MDYRISLNSLTGLVTKTKLGLDQVDNTSDLNKPVSTATQTALGLKADNTSVQTSLNAQQQQLDQKANALDLTTHEADTGNPHLVTKDQVGLGFVDNTADADKPVSTAMQAALDLKANVADLTGILSGGTITLDKAAVGLGNVDNTSDLNKPISTATQTALDAKVNVADMVITCQVVR